MHGPCRVIRRSSGEVDGVWNALNLIQMQFCARGPGNGGEQGTGTAGNREQGIGNSGRRSVGSTARRPEAAVTKAAEGMPSQAGGSRYVSAFFRDGPSSRGRADAGRRVTRRASVADPSLPRPSDQARRVRAGRAAARWAGMQNGRDRVARPRGSGALRHRIGAAEIFLGNGPADEARRAESGSRVRCFRCGRGRPAGRQGVLPGSSWRN
jgi:hypothetical protein